MYKSYRFLGAALAMLPLVIWPAAADAEIKIGFINPIKVLEMAPQAEAARGELEREFAQRKDELEAEEANIRRAEEKMTRDTAIMSEAERQGVERDLLARKRDLRRAKEEFREDLNLRRNDELAKLQKEVLKVINELAREKGYDLIVGEGVVFASEAIDISELVLERLRRLPPPAANGKPAGKSGE